MHKKLAGALGGAALWLACTAAPAVAKVAPHMHHHPRFW
jgi:hypothetical protein